MDATKDISTEQLFSRASLKCDLNVTLNESEDVKDTSAGLRNIKELVTVQLLEQQS